MTIYRPPMTEFRDFKEEELEITWEWFPEENCAMGDYICSGDEEYDKQEHQKIIDRLNKGDWYAWCYLKCTAKLKAFPEVEGTDCLGGISLSEWGEGEWSTERYIKSEGRDIKDWAIDSLRAALQEKLDDSRKFIEFANLNLIDHEGTLFSEQEAKA